MVQESGRVRHLGEPGVRNGEELDLRFNSAIPQPVRQRLQIALRAGEEAPQEQVYDSGLPRHFAGYHLQKPSKEIPHHGQHISARLERHLCRKRLDSHAAGRRRRQGDQTGLSLWYRGPREDLEIRGRFVGRDRFRPHVRQDGLPALHYDGLLLLRLDYRHRPEEQDQRLHQVPGGLRQVGRQGRHQRRA